MALLIYILIALIASAGFFYWIYKNYPDRIIDLDSSTEDDIHLSWLFSESLAAALLYGLFWPASIQGSITVWLAKKIWNVIWKKWIRPHVVKTINTKKPK